MATSVLLVLIEFALIYAIYYETYRRVARAVTVCVRCLLPVAKRACNRLIERRAERVKSQTKETTKEFSFRSPLQKSRSSSGTSTRDDGTFRNACQGKTTVILPHADARYK